MLDQGDLVLVKQRLQPLARRLLEVARPQRPDHHAVVEDPELEQLQGSGGRRQDYELLRVGAQVFGEDPEGPDLRCSGELA